MRFAADRNRASRFLVALLEREPFGDEIWHVFPQAVKLDHVEARRNGQRYHAIGKVEAFLDDVNALRKLSGTEPMTAAELNGAGQPLWLRSAGKDGGM